MAKKSKPPTKKQMLDTAERVLKLTGKMVSIPTEGALKHTTPVPTRNNVTQGDREMLEALIDQTSLHATLFTIAKVCIEKAEHIHTNWQDHKLAAEWERQGALIEKRAEVCREWGL